MPTLPTALSTSSVTSTNCVLRAVLTRKTSIFPPPKAHKFYHWHFQPLRHALASPPVHPQFTRRALFLRAKCEKVRSVIQDRLSWLSTKKAERRPWSSSQAGAAAKKSGGSRANEHRHAS